MFQWQAKYKVPGNLLYTKVQTVYTQAIKQDNSTSC